MQEKDIYSELSSIRNMMERSTKFISLSGLSGILAGIYALIGAAIAYQIIYPSGDYYLSDTKVLFTIVVVALTVLCFSLITGVLLTLRQAKKKRENPWNPVSKKLLFNVAVPLCTGGVFILILISKDQFGIIAPASLIFYGLALVAGSQYTFSEVKWLGILEILLGLIATLLPGYEIIFWALGFGVLHIIYGSMMHFKYKQ